MRRRDFIKASGVAALAPLALFKTATGIVIDNPYLKAESASRGEQDLTNLAKWYEETMEWQASRGEQPYQNYEGEIGIYDSVVFKETKQ